MCAEFEGPIPCSSPKEESFHEEENANDSGMVLGTSIGDIITDEEDMELLHPQINDEPPQNNSLNKHGKLKKKPKIHRPCPYCSNFQSALTRPLTLKHKHEPDVASALLEPPNERRKAFDVLKKEGIFRFKVESPLIF